MAGSVLPPGEDDERRRKAGPTDDEELIDRLRAAVRRYRQTGGPSRAELVVDGMRMTFEEQYLAPPLPPTRE